MKAPRLSILASFVASIGGFSYCSILSAAWKETAKVERKTQTLNDELENFRFALEEMSIKEQMQLQYLSQPEPEPAAQTATAKPLSLPESKPNPAITAFINWLVKRNPPFASVRDVQRSSVPELKGWKADQIRELFAQAENQGLGLINEGTFYHVSLLQQ
jgi:curved DNA-binding protein CbpA